MWRGICFQHSQPALWERHSAYPKAGNGSYLSNTPFSAVATLALGLPLLQLLVGIRVNNVLLLEARAFGKIHDD